MLALDSAYGIFNNIPSRIDPTGLDLQLPCEEKYFRLSSQQEMVMYSMFPKPKMKVLDAFQRLFTTEIDPDLTSLVLVHAAASNGYAPRTSSDNMDAINLSCWDMMILVHGTQFLVFQLIIVLILTVLYTFVWQNLFANPFQRISPLALQPISPMFEPIKTALQNWKTIWDEIKASIPASELPMMGFETSADSYWTVTRMLVSKLESRTSVASVNGDASPYASNDGSSERTNNSIHIARGLDFMPLEVDTDKQCSHLKKIFRT